MIIDSTMSLLTALLETMFTKEMLFVYLFVIGFTNFAYFVLKNKKVLSKKAIDNTITTLLIFAINIIISPVVYYTVGLVTKFYKFMQIPTIPAEFWANTHWSIIVLISVVTVDFADYWNHRFMHTKIGWPTHLVHHSDSYVNGFTTFRIHFLEAVVMRISYIFLLSWMGINAETVIAVTLLTALHNAYVHFEVDIDHGPLNWLLASPRFHRWHHADVPEAYGKNLANIIPLWDMVFGTYYKAGRCDAQMGAAKEGIPDTDAVKLFLLPFQLYFRKISALFQVKNLKPE